MAFLLGKEKIDLADFKYEKVDKSVDRAAKELKLHQLFEQSGMIFNDWFIYIFNINEQFTKGELKSESRIKFTVKEKTVMASVIDPLIDACMLSLGGKKGIKYYTFIRSFYRDGFITNKSLRDGRTLQFPIVQLKNAPISKASEISELVDYINGVCTGAFKGVGVHTLARDDSADIKGYKSGDPICKRFFKRLNNDVSNLLSYSLDYKKMPESDEDKKVFEIDLKENLNTMLDDLVKVGQYVVLLNVKQFTNKQKVTRIIVDAMTCSGNFTNDFNKDKAKRVFDELVRGQFEMINGENVQMKFPKVKAMNRVNTRPGYFAKDKLVDYTLDSVMITYEASQDEIIDKICEIRNLNSEIYKSVQKKKNRFETRYPYRLDARATTD